MSFDEVPEDSDSEPIPDDVHDRETHAAPQPDFQQEQSEIVETSDASLEYDQQEDHYLHPLSVIFSLVDLIKQNLIPAVLGIFGAARGDLFFVGLAVLFFVPTMAVSLIRYFTIRYRISNGELVVQEGLIFQRVRTVPVERIQNIDLVQGVLHRMLNLAEVRVETASGTKPEAVLKVLSLDQVERLRAGVRQHRSVAAVGAFDADPSVADDNEGAAATVGSVANDRGHQLLKIPLWWLAQAGFASNKGFVLVGLLIGFYFQFDRRNPGELDSFNFRFLNNWLPDDGGMLMTFCIAVAALIAAMLLLRILGIGWFVLRFSDTNCVKSAMTSRYLADC